MHFAAIAIALISLLIWLALFFFNGHFWQIWSAEADREKAGAPSVWPSVVAVVPARNEAETIKETVSALLRQNYSGRLSILVVDDHSEDGTGELARNAARERDPAKRVTVISAPDLAPGWTGKLWALQSGVTCAAAIAPDFYWFTDADIVHSPDTLKELISRAENNHLDLASLMVLLQARSFVEKLIIPPFLYFFLMLYPPSRIESEKSRTAGAAGGCILLRRETLERAGGLATIRSEIIDDCSLARVIKRSGGKIWMGLTRASISLRRYANWPELQNMIARTAFTQLNYSVLRLIGTLFGLLMTFVAPVVLTFSTNPRIWVPALLAWCVMSASFLPTVVFYRLSPIWSPALPLSALFYSYATLLSALRYWRGRGGQWKGRAQAPGAGK
ncbi:MAG TPA: glycosyltransferase [Candidatus Eremiobacteraceae bacterium]|nr:glycosyltransferase [Candidatus Eremiobacteraceae bacterium]